MSINRNNNNNSFADSARLAIRDIKHDIAGLWVSAAVHSDLGTMRELYRNSYLMDDMMGDEDLVSAIVDAGKVHVVAWMLGKREFKHLVSKVAWACVRKNCNMQLFYVIYNTNPDAIDIHDPRITAAALRLTNVDLLRWLYLRGVRSDDVRLVYDAEVDAEEDPKDPEDELMGEEVMREELAADNKKRSAASVVADKARKRAAISAFVAAKAEKAAKDKRAAAIVAIFAESAKEEAEEKGAALLAYLAKKEREEAAAAGDTAGDNNKESMDEDNSSDDSSSDEEDDSSSSSSSDNEDNEEDNNDDSEEIAADAAAIVVDN